MSETARTTPMPVRAARLLVRACGKAALSTLSAENGAPYGSLVTVATDQAGMPILLLSRLADHTRNIESDARVSLLFDGTGGHANPQAGPRATLMGRASRIEDEGARRRFLARHPYAAMYAGFGDFGLFRVIVERIHWVGGFARALWLDRNYAIENGAAQAMSGAEEAICARMNENHRDSIDLCATRLLKQRGRNWHMVAVDADGCDLARGEKVVRLPFERTANGPDEACRMVTELAESAARP